MSVAQPQREIEDPVIAIGVLAQKLGLSVVAVYRFGSLRAQDSPLSLRERERVRADYEKVLGILRCSARGPHPLPLSGHRPQVGRERGDISNTL